MPNTINRIVGILMPVIICLVASISILRSITPSLASYQFIFASLGLFFAFALSRLDLERFGITSIIWYIASVVPLLLTEIFGVVSRGSTRWIDIFGFRFQTSEMAKITLILFAARWLATHNVNNVKNTIQFVLMMSVPTLLIAIQPDLGSALMIVGIGIVAIIAAGIPFKHILLLFSVCLCIIPMTYLCLQSYQRARVHSFMSPQSDPLGKGYNAMQSTIAVGSGKITGRGLGQGTQSHLRFLPERHTDFIFASFVEELGLVGGGILIFSYAWLSISLLTLAKSALSPTTSLIALISTGHFLIQALVNIGMNMGILPITGVTLPFVSYGGSSLLSSLIIIGINLSFALHQRTTLTHLELS